MALIAQKFRVVQRKVIERQTNTRLPPTVMESGILGQKNGRTEAMNKRYRKKRRKIENSTGKEAAFGGGVPSRSMVSTLSSVRQGDGGVLHVKKWKLTGVGLCVVSKRSPRRLVDLLIKIPSLVQLSEEGPNRPRHHPQPHTPRRPPAHARPLILRLQT